jgi:FKBP-type peptidyl-prolyl cis-trans isomerase
LPIVFRYLFFFFFNENLEWRLIKELLIDNFNKFSINKSMKLLNLIGVFAIGSAMMLMTSCGGGSIESAKIGTSDLDSASYAFGVLIGERFFPKEFYEELNIELLAKGVMHSRDSSAILTGPEANAIVTKFNEAIQSKEYDVNIKEGEDFLAENKKREGVQVTPSGLQYEVLTEGTGAKPVATDKVKTNYKGTYINGETFDANEGAEFGLNQVIPGWTEGIQLMSVGSKYNFFIPYELAYGKAGRQGSIEPYKTLVFEVELLDIVPADAPAPAEGN